MKVVGRILYAISMVIVFWFFVDYTQGIIDARYYEKYGIPPLEQAIPDYSYYYGSVPNYYDNDPIIEIDYINIHIRGYMVATTNIVNNQATVETYVYLLIHRPEYNFTENEYYLYYLDDDIAQVNRLSYFRSNRNLLIGVNDDLNVYLDTDRLLLLNGKDVEIRDEDGNAIYVFTFNMEDRTKLKDELEAYYLANNKFPTNELNSIDIYHYRTHAEKALNEFINIFYIAMGIYIVLLVTTTYFVFFFKRKRTGKLEPSEPFKKYEELKKKKQEESV